MTQSVTPNQALLEQARQILRREASDREVVDESLRFVMSHVKALTLLDRAALDRGLDLLENGAAAAAQDPGVRDRAWR